LERPGDDIVIEFREGEGRNKTSVDFTRHDLHCLKPGQWLNDKVMVYRDWNGLYAYFPE
jgi:hypothetical protein